MRSPSTISFGTDLGTERAKPPAHLSRQAKRWWRSVLDAYDLEPHRVAILTAAAEAWDRKEQARLIISEEGVVIPASRFKHWSADPQLVRTPIAHPAVHVEDVAAMRFAHLVRDIGLDGTPGQEVHLP